MAEVDEFELFRARSYGVESELRHQRASSVRVHNTTGHGRSGSSAVRQRGSGKTHRRHGDTATGSSRPSAPDTTPAAESTTAHRPTAAERKASFKSSSKRRAVCEECTQEDDSAGVATDFNDRPDPNSGGTADHATDGDSRAQETNGSWRHDGDDCSGEGGGEAHVPVDGRAQNRGVVFGGGRHDGRAILLSEVTENDGVASSGDDDETCRVYRMRSFYTKSGNVVNRGDSVRVHGPKYRGSGGGHPGGGGGGSLARNTRQTWAGTGLPPASGWLATVPDGSCDETAYDSGCDRKLIDHGGDERSATTSGRMSDPAAAGRSEQIVDKREFQTTPISIMNAGATSTTARRDLLTVEPRSTSTAKRRLRNESTEEGAAGSVSSSTYRVLVIGGQGVGKTTLAQQIMTSEYLANKDSFTGE